MNRGKTANRTAKGKDRSGSGWLSRAVKGGVLGLAATIFCILAFAVAVKQFGLSDMVISAVNQTIKVVSIFLAAYAAAKSSPENKLLAGAGAGAAYDFGIFGIFADPKPLGQGAAAARRPRYGVADRGADGDHLCAARGGKNQARLERRPRAACENR